MAKEEKPEGQKKTAISDKEKKRIKDEAGGTTLSRKEWIKLMNKHS